MSEEIKVGSFNKPTRKPMPGKTDQKSEAASVSTEEAIVVLNEKMDSVLKHLQAIDWKMWVYLKANNYID